MGSRRKSWSCIDYTKVNVQPWLEIDLEQNYIVLDVFISMHPYTYDAKYRFLESFDVLVSNETGRTNGTRCISNHSLFYRLYDRIYCNSKPQGRFVRIQTPLTEYNQYFGICSVEVTGEYLIN